MTVPAAAARPPARELRWLMPLALGVSTTVGFVDRLNLSLAVPSIAAEFRWSDEEVGARGGQLMSLFFIGYGLSNILLTPLAARLGPRRALLLIVVLFSLFSALGAPLSSSLVLFGATRLAMGLGEGPHFPMMSALTRAWFPPGERSRANGLWIGGAVLATVITPLIVVPVIGAFGWRAMLVAVGLTGMLVTLPLLWLVVRDTPEQAPWLPRAEVDRLRALRAAGASPDEDEGQADHGRTRLAFLRRPVFWLVVLAGSLNNFCAFGVLNWLPTYFARGRQLAFDQLAIAASLPFLLGLLGVAAAAWLGDRTQRRALVAGAGFLGAALFVWAAAGAPGIPLTVACFALAVFCQSAYTPQEFALVQRILPRAAVATGSGIYNGIAIIVGGGLGTAVIGGVVSWTGSYAAGMHAIVVVALANALLLMGLSRTLRY